ncbi:ECF-type sigma factor [Paenibacillus filicis]|uniref:ECF-type sigma factor n=1 Tax=Paenibacillus filicis TaxID=669464 RepID=A0ABU9DVK6_9BACL
MGMLAKAAADGEQATKTEVKGVKVLNQQSIADLREYKRKAARAKLLSRYVVEDDAELMALKAETGKIDETMEALRTVNVRYAEIIKRRFIDGDTVDEIASDLCIARKTYDRWRKRAETEFEKLYTGL